MSAMNQHLMREISERRKIEEALQESESRYRILAENATDVIWTCDMPLRFTYVSPSVRRMFGYTEEEALSKKVEEITTPASFDTATKVLSEEREIEALREKDLTRSRTIELELIHKNGSRVWTETTMTFLRDLHEHAVGILGVTRDITERRRLEAQLLWSQKMEAIGTLAGGVAHDFNNLLQVIHGYAELLLMTRPGEKKRRQALREVLGAARRGRELTQKLLTFSRRVESKRRPLDLNHTVKQVRDLLSRTIAKNIGIQLHLADDLRTVNADPTEIEQVLMNLTVNARDAMAEGGTLLIETRNATLDEAFCRSHAGARCGEYASLVISDSGHGMGEETLKHIFEPFYTTKGVGKGTGLGLATSYGIVKKHEGYIACQSDVGKGTTFEIYLPAHTPPGRPIPGEGEEGGTRG